MKCRIKQQLSFSSVWTAVLGLVMLVTLSLQTHAASLPENDYPTNARADYVFACMQVNGQTRETLNRCSCSIDRIADLLPFDDYEQAETIMSVVQQGGEKVGMFRTYGPLKETVKTLKKAQVEAELLCF
ncbi:MAG: hypothetical protein AAFR75_07910 [Pseudomonadota bacterium]